MVEKKVILVGVGADSSNIRPVPDLVDDSTFDYVPIPETWLTADQYTYVDFPLDEQREPATGDQSPERVASDEIEAISPFGYDGDWIIDPHRISEHPVHYDPNFEALTYGDKRGQGGRGNALAELNPGDGLGFYTGIEDGDGKHRYIWGFFTVQEVADLEGYDTRAYRDRLKDFPENAHTRRLLGAGKAKHEGGDEPALVIVDGTEPARLLERPVKISTRTDDSSGNTYWLQERFIGEFCYDLERHTLNEYTGLSGVDIKHALHLDIDPDSFIEHLESWQSQQYQ